MQSKDPDLIELNAKKIALETGLRLLQAADSFYLFFEGYYRNPIVLNTRGLEGLRRMRNEKEERAEAEQIRKYRRRKIMIERKIDNRRYLALSESGKQMKFRLELLCAPKRKDGKTLIVAFDVPENHASYRRCFRRILRECGFIKLQNSVWQSDKSAEGPLIAWVRHLNATAWVRIFLSTEL